MAAVKLKDVATRAGVSEGTASLVLNNRPGVSDVTRARVREAAHVLGYTPNRIARGLATRRTRTIGLAVTDIENPFFSSITKYISQFLREHAYSTILQLSQDDLKVEDAIITSFIGNRVDGVIIIPNSLSSPLSLPYVDKLRDHGIPFVYCTSYYPHIPGDCVMTDLKQGSYRLTKMLLEMGHRDIVLYTIENLEVVPGALRIEGFKQALAEGGVQFKDELIVACKYPDLYNGYHRTLELFPARRPDAITAINDFLALGIRKALLELGLSIPEQVSVAGFDDIMFASIAEHPLTTVRQNIPQICRDTVELLLDRINGSKGEPRLLKIFPELVVGQTTGRCARARVVDAW